MRRNRLNLATLRSRHLPRLPRRGFHTEELFDAQQGLVMTRRGLLGLAGATAMAMPLASAADARPFQFVAGRKRVTFRIGGQDKWVIDTRQFGGHPRLTVSRQKDSICVELKDARYPGTEIPADMLCELKRGPVGWQMHLKLAWGGFESRTPFGSWLAGDVAARSRVRLDGRLCGLGHAAGLFAQGAAQAEFSPNWTMHLTGRGVARLHGMGGGASSDTLSVSLLTPREASLLARPAEKRALFALQRRELAWPLGPDFGGQHPWNLIASNGSFDVIHIEAGENSSGKPCHALAAESRGENPSFYFAPGAGLRGSDGSPSRLGLRNARYAVTFDGMHRESAFVADFDSAPTWIHAGGSSFEVSGGPETEPFELTASRGGRSRVRCAPALRRISAPLEGAIVEPGPVREGTLLAIAFPPASNQVKTNKTLQATQMVPQYTLPSLEAPIFNLTVTRPDDLLVLNFDFFNLEITSTGGVTSLSRAVAGQPAYIVAGFAPQHIVEAAFSEGEIEFPLPADAEPPVPARLAGPSRLAFLIPDSVQSMPYTLDALLDWSKFEQSVTPLATPPPAQMLPLTRGVSVSHVVEEPHITVAQKSTDYYKTVQPVMVEANTAKAKKPPKGKVTIAPTTIAPSTVANLAEIFRVKEPELYQTAIEAPYRLILSPNYFAGWAHAAKAVTHAGRTELWHTRLGVRQQNGKIDEQNDYYRTVRAVWSEDYQEVCPEAVVDKPVFPPANYATSPVTLDRYQLVRLSADQSLSKGDGSPYVPTPVQVNRLMLSTLGAWMNVHGTWAPVDQGINDKKCANSAFSLVQWDQITSMGRDQFVRVITEGYLLPFGHRAVQIIITERKFDHTPAKNQMAAYLRQQIFVVVKEHEKTYPAPGQPHANGPKLPFQMVRITTNSTPALDPRQALLSEDKNSSNIRAYYPRVSGTDFLFQMQGIDWEGKTCQFTAPLIYLDATIGRIPNYITELISVYGSGSKNTDRRKRPLSGQKLAYAKNNKPGDTTFETKSLTWIAEPWEVNQPPARPQPYFYPAIEEAAVRVATVEQLTSASASTRIGYHPTYNQAGLDSPANKGQVFAELLDVVPLAFGSAGAGADKVGGLLTPSMTLSGLSRSLGVVAGDVAKMVAGTFDPADIFKDALNAKLLGDITLMEVITKLADFSGALDKVPKFITQPSSDTVVTTFTWQPEINNVPATDSFFVVTGDKSSALTLSATLTKHLDNKPPTYEVTGTLKQFEIHLVPSVMDLLVVSFNSLSFSSVNGKKPDFSVDMGNMSFEGPLSFINALRDLIPMDGFKDPPSLNITSDGIEMGYSITLPPVGVGVFALSNVSLGGTLNIYFINKPISFEFDFCTEDQPFLLTVSFFGGGGYFGMALSPKTGITRMSGGFDFGGSFALDIGVASGGVHALAGISYTYDIASGSTLTGYLKLGGSVEVLGIITVSVEFDMSLTYYSQGNRLHGVATLTVEISILFFSISVGLTVQRDFAGSSGPQASLLEGGAPLPLGPTTVAFADQMSAADWQTYCEAFA